MVKVHKKIPKTRRKPRLSRTKLLCAAGLTLCDLQLTNTDAAKQPDGYFSEPKHRNIYGPSSETFLPAIENNASIRRDDFLNTTKPVNHGSDRVDMSNLRPVTPSDVQRGTTRYPRITEETIRASEKLQQTLNGSNQVRTSSNRPINGLPHPPPPQWIRDNRYEQPQTNIQQNVHRQDRRIASESMIPPTFNAYPNTKKNKRDASLNAQRDEQAMSPNFAANSRGQQRRVPLHLQHASNAYQSQQQTDVYPNSNQAPRAFKTVSPTQPHDGYGQEEIANNRHARSYQSRIMHTYPERQQSIPEPNMNHDLTRTEYESRGKWSQKVNEGQQYNQFAVNQGGRSGFRSLREPTVHQHTRGIAMNHRSQKLSNTNLDSEMGQAMDDPNNAVVSLVPGTSNSQLAIVPSSFQDVIQEDRINQVQSLVEAGAWLSFGSIQKISWCLLAISLLSYAAVSPSTLPLTEYNLQFYENFRLVCLSTIAPALYMLFVFDPRENDVNSVTNVFVVTFFFGYAGIYILELIATTIVRLSLFVWLEPNVFSLTPKVPLPVLPWVLREWQYRPKRITLFAADFATSCIACPVIEECVKLFLLQRISKLPRNFNWVMKSYHKREAKQRVAEMLKREHDEYDCTSANQYVTNMLAISVALKLADAARRILLYTKATDANKGFYAICRGIFPIQELCGAIMAIALARRDLLGVDVPRWKMLAPAIVIHAMANFRGKRPIFKWNASSPWSEMQLSPLNIPDSSTFLQLVKKGYAKLMWIVTISRVFGYCVKNYYMVNRHALKRTTKYAGNHAAFSAELVTAESLKNLKK